MAPTTPTLICCLPHPLSLLAPFPSPSLALPPIPPPPSPSPYAVPVVGRRRLHLPLVPSHLPPPPPHRTTTSVSRCPHRRLPPPLPPPRAASTSSVVASLSSGASAFASPSRHLRLCITSSLPATSDGRRLDLASVWSEHADLTTCVPSSPHPLTPSDRPRPDPTSPPLSSLRPTPVLVLQIEGRLKMATFMVAHISAGAGRSHVSFLLQ